MSRILKSAVTGKDPKSLLKKETNRRARATWSPQTPEDAENVAAVAEEEPAGVVEVDRESTILTSKKLARSQEDHQGPQEADLTSKQQRERITTLKKTTEVTLLHLRF